MQNRSARSYKPNPPRASIAEKLESSFKKRSQSEVNLAPRPNVKNWSGGFVKPDGTRIGLFVPPVSES